MKKNIDNHFDKYIKKLLRIEIAFVDIVSAADTA